MMNSSPAFISTPADLDYDFEVKLKALLNRGGLVLSKALFPESNSREDIIVIDATFIKQLEGGLMATDFGADLVKKISLAFVDAYSMRSMRLQDIKTILYNQLMEIMVAKVKPIKPSKFTDNNRLQVIIANGGAKMGKTSAIAKMAYLLYANNYKVTIGVCSGGNAGNNNYIKGLLHNTPCNLVLSDNNESYFSIASRANQIAIDKKSDILLLDTESKLTTNIHFLKEFNNIAKIFSNTLTNDAPHLVMVVSALASPYDIEQLIKFSNVANITGIVITNLDKGMQCGIIVNIMSQFNLPLHGISLGDNLGDLQDFSAVEYVRGFLNINHF